MNGDVRYLIYLFQIKNYEIYEFENFNKLLNRFLKK
jgi:hypothetical protein